MTTYDFKDLGDWAAEAERRLVETFKATCLEVGRRVIEGTPRDTGKLANSWRSGTADAIDKTPRQPDPGAAEALAELERVVAALTPEQVFAMVNDVNYAAIVEFGTSQRAPAAMMRLAVMAWPTIVAQAAAKVGGSGS
jgi:hypothetical protein